MVDLGLRASLTFLANADKPDGSTVVMAGSTTIDVISTSVSGFDCDGDDEDDGDDDDEAEKKLEEDSSWSSEEEEEEEAEAEGANMVSNCSTDNRCVGGVSNKPPSLAPPAPETPPETPP